MGSDDLLDIYPVQSGEVLLVEGHHPRELLPFHPTGVVGVDEVHARGLVREGGVGEEIDLCKRVWDSGGKVLYVPGISITHVGGASSPDTARARIWRAQGNVRYTRKHYGRAMLAIARVTAVLAYASSLPLWIARALTRRNTWKESLTEAVRYGRALMSR